MTTACSSREDEWNTMALVVCVKILILGNLDFVTFIVLYDDQRDAK